MTNPTDRRAITRKVGDPLLVVVATGGCTPEGPSLVLSAPVIPGGWADVSADATTTWLVGSGVCLDRPGEAHVEGVTLVNASGIAVVGFGLSAPPAHYGEQLTLGQTGASSAAATVVCSPSGIPTSQPDVARYVSALDVAIQRTAERGTFDAIEIRWTSEGGRVGTLELPIAVVLCERAPCRP